MDEMVVLLIPLLGTTLGAAMVFFMKDNINAKIEKTLLGFAAGVMIAASVWSLLIPAIDMSKEQGRIAWLPAAVGFMLGILFLLLIDSIVPHLHLDSDKPEGVKSKFSKTTMMMFAVTIHNIPEGMAVGVAYAGAIMEGAIISMPLKGQGMSKMRAFKCGFLSGVVEPIGAFITILLTSKIIVILPYLLAFAAGAMIYVVIEELIPESQSGEHTNIGTIGAAIGFVLMMVLDVALG